MRIALGIAYRGGAYQGWQSQPGGRTVQDHLERALSAFADLPLHCICAGRTDAGVHALNQVVHLEAPIERSADAWVRGSNRHLPDDIAVQWAQFVGADFHARNSAVGRRYAYVLLESKARPGLESGLVGWTHRRLDGAAMKLAAEALRGRHDFSAFRSAECQASSPVKILNALAIEQRGPYWRFDFDADGFLHHMIRNLMGCLIAVGGGARDPAWIAELLAAKDRTRVAATFAADGLYFLGPYYDPGHAIPDRTPALSWLP